MRPQSFVEVVRQASALALRMAVDQVQTLAGALAIRGAERAGLARPNVLRTVDRRVAELRGESGKAPVTLVVEAEAVDADRSAWEAARAPQSSVVEAVGRGRWARRL